MLLSESLTFPILAFAVSHFNLILEAATINLKSFTGACIFFLLFALVQNPGRTVLILFQRPKTTSKNIVGIKPRNSVNYMT